MELAPMLTCGKHMWRSRGISLQEPGFAANDVNDVQGTTLMAYHLWALTSFAKMQGGHDAIQNPRQMAYDIHGCS